jgi:hypothetical protein
MAELKGPCSRSVRFTGAARADARRQPHHRRELDARSFITMTYAVIDLDLATMTYAPGTRR